MDLVVRSIPLGPLRRAAWAYDAGASVQGRSKFPGRLGGQFAYVGNLHPVIQFDTASCSIRECGLLAGTPGRRAVGRALVSGQDRVPGSGGTGTGTRADDPGVRRSKAARSHGAGKRIRRLGDRRSPGAEEPFPFGEGNRRRFPLNLPSASKIPGASATDT